MQKVKSIYPVGPVPQTQSRCLCRKLMMESFLQWSTAPDQRSGHMLAHRLVLRKLDRKLPLDGVCGRLSLSKMIHDHFSRARRRQSAPGNCHIEKSADVIAARRPTGEKRHRIMRSPRNASANHRKALYPLFTDQQARSVRLCACAATNRDAHSDSRLLRSAKSARREAPKANLQSFVR